MGKPTICIGENKDADQLRGNREADQRLCFRYSDSTILLLLKSEISSAVNMERQLLKLPFALGKFTMLNRNLTLEEMYI